MLANWVHLNLSHCRCKSKFFKHSGATRSLIQGQTEAGPISFNSFLVKQRNFIPVFLQVGAHLVHRSGQTISVAVRIMAWWRLQIVISVDRCVHITYSNSDLRFDQRMPNNSFCTL